MRFVVALFSLFASGFNLAATSCPQQYCIAVVDAGSTGSRLHLFAFDRDADKQIVNIHELLSKKVKPGLATIDAQSQVMDKYLTELMTSISSYEVPLYFYATAGMRLLPEDKQKERYAFIRDWFKQHPTWTLQDAKTISGVEEGSFAWLAVNNQLESKPVGVVDIGGASAQIAFPITDTTGIPEANVKRVSFKNQSMTLFVQSFLGLGQTELLKKISREAHCFPKAYPMVDNTLGAGDAFLCEAGLMPIINHFQVAQSIQPILEKNMPLNWYAIGAPAMTVQSQSFAPHFAEAAFSTLQLRQDADSEFCHNDWSTIKQTYPKDNYVSGYCLYPSYYHALLTQSYGINEDTVIKTLNPNATEDWTLGVVYAQAAR